MRTRDETLQQGILGGIKQVGEDLDSMIDEIHGSFDPRAGSLQRMPGKLLTASSTTSTVWSINQLRFRDANTIVERIDGTLGVQPDLAPLPGFVFDEYPLLPAPDPRDYPEPTPSVNPPIPPLPYPDPRVSPIPGPGTPGQSPEPGLAPGPMDRDLQIGSATLKATLDALTLIEANDDRTFFMTKEWKNNAPKIYCSAHTTTAPYLWWFVFTERGTANSDIRVLGAEDEVSLGFWDDVTANPNYFSVGIAAGGWTSGDIPMGNTIIVITFTAEDTLGNTILINGSSISEVVTVTVSNPVAMDVSVTPAIINLRIVTNQTPQVDSSLVIQNDGNVGIDYTTIITPHASLIGMFTLASDTGSVAKGLTGPSTLQFVPAGLSNGDYNGTDLEYTSEYEHDPSEFEIDNVTVNVKVSSPLLDNIKVRLTSPTTWPGWAMNRTMIYQGYTGSYWYWSFYDGSRGVYYYVSGTGLNNYAKLRTNVSGFGPSLTMPTTFRFADGYPISIASGATGYGASLDPVTIEVGPDVF